MAHRMLFFDIETSNLEANFGTILCIGYRWLGQAANQTKVLSIQDVNGICKACKRVDQPTNDKALLQAVTPILSSADSWFTWFGAAPYGFDERFINSRLIYHRLPPLPPVFHVDGWKTAKTQLHLNSNRLASVQAFLELPTAKSALAPTAWNLAKAGDVKGLQYVIGHCRLDVNVLPEAYQRLLPLIKRHPNLNLFGNGQGCPNCQSTHFQRRGVAHASTGTYPRYQCQSCGKWLRGTKAEKRTTLVGI